MITEYLRHVVLRHRDEIAIVDGDERISYGELSQRAQAAGQWLRATLDPQPGDVIALSLDNSWQFVACVFAALELGCVLLPCNPQWRAAELQPLVTKLGVRGAVIEPRCAVEWNQISGLIPNNCLLTRDGMPSRCDTSGVGSLPSLDAFGENAAVVYAPTSGSTGIPRLVPRSHRNLIATVHNVGGTLDVGPGRRILGVVPFHFNAGFNNSLIVPLLTGATLVVVRQFSPGACAELARREEADSLFGSPFIFGCLVECDPALLSTLKYCFTTGGRIPSSLVERWRQRFGPTLRQSYGLSESGMVACERRGDRPISPLGASIGEPLQGAEIVVRGTDGQKLGPQEIGELAIRSASVMSGYFGEPELNRALFHNGFFRTGDLGCFDSTGNFHLTGRLGRVMNIAGVKVDPVQVERVVEMLPGVASCHVDTIPNGRGGEVIRARIVPREGLPITRRDVIEQCRRQLAEYKLPRVVEFLETSPDNIAGKIPHHR
jgi:acyl-CoA synthetase (AMP-forming)/AMP-acid ligase II